MPHVLETPSELPFTWTVTPRSGHLSTHHLPDPWYLFSSPTSEPVGVRAQGGGGVRQTGLGGRLRQEHGPRNTWTSTHTWGQPGCYLSAGPHEGGTQRPQALLAGSQAQSREVGSGDLKTNAGFNLGHGNARGLCSLGKECPGQGQAQP